MRAYELNTPTALPVGPSASTELGSLLDQAKTKPHALNKLEKGIDAILIATNKLVAAIKKPKTQQSIKPNASMPTESLEETTIQDVPSLKSKIQSIDANIKLLSSFKLDKKILAVVESLKKEIDEFEDEIKVALKQASESYKSLDPYISKMLAKTGSNNPQDIAKARSIFLTDEIPIEDAKHFLEIAQIGVIDMTAMVNKPEGLIDEFVINDPVVKRVYDKVIDDFINWIPGKTAGNIGPGELAFVMLGNPAGKETKGDLKIGDEMFEIKAGDTKRKVTKAGTLGTPGHTGAIFDTGISGKAMWPQVKSILAAAGFENMVTAPVKDSAGKVKQFSRYSLINTNFENWNQEFDRLKFNVNQRANLLTQIAQIIFPYQEFNPNEVKSEIKSILAKTKGRLAPAEIPPGVTKQLEHNTDLLRYFGKLALRTYREEGESKDNFMFINKSTKKYKIFRGDQLDKELDNPDSNLKVMGGIAFSLTDAQSKAVPKFSLV